MRFGLIDWVIVGVYLAAVLALGISSSRRVRGSAGGDELFLAGRGMPMWAVAISVLATSLSAATFIGGPQQAYASDLTYLSANVGGLLAVIIVAVLFIPAYYRLGVTSVYELLGHALGGSVRSAASAMFMGGRLLASGARLYMVAMPFAWLAFGDLEPSSLVSSIVIITVAAAVYTAAGGIRAVIWTDVVQAVVLVGAVALAFVLLWGKIPLTAGEMVDVLRNDPDGDKTRFLDFSVAIDRPFTVWTALIGFTLFNVAAFGADQDLTQRMLTCSSARRGAWSVILSNLIGWPVVLLFLLLGLLLYVFYTRPELTGAPPLDPDGDTRRVFLRFMLEEMPVGVRGLMVAGLFASAMSSLDSALGAMASTAIADFYRPWRARRGHAADPAKYERRLARLAIALWAAALAGVAMGCIAWQQASGQTLIEFALGVMVFAYAGLLGVFLTVLLTRRGSAASALTAFVLGTLAVLVLTKTPLAFPWRMTVATAVSFGVCLLGNDRRDV